MDIIFIVLIPVGALIGFALGMVVSSRRIKQLESDLANCREGQ